MLNIIFMGTPDFAVASLEILHKHHNVQAVVTVPDKPAGRGRKIRTSPVKDFAVENNIPVFQPEKLRNDEFTEELEKLKPDLMVVVAFRMLPKSIWSIPKIGTFNLHASLLPQYRGAAPINHAIINGEKVSGNTTFFIDDKIDTGNILLQEEVIIEKDDNAGDLHDKLMTSGAQLVLKTVNSLEKGEITPIPQDDSSILKPAPKIFKEDCLIDWNQNAENIINKIRGLSPYPAAWSKAIYQDKDTSLKIYRAYFQPLDHTKSTGEVNPNSKDFLEVYVNGGVIQISELQPESKKRMSAKDFINGNELNLLKFTN